MGSFNHPGAQEQGNCREQEMVHAPLTREIISVVDIPKASHLALQVIVWACEAALFSSQEVETTSAAQPSTWNQSAISSGDTPPTFPVDLTKDDGTTAMLKILLLAKSTGWKNSIGHGKHIRNRLRTIFRVGFIMQTKAFYLGKCSLLLSLFALQLVYICINQIYPIHRWPKISIRVLLT